MGILALGESSRCSSASIRTKCPVAPIFNPVAGKTDFTIVNRVDFTKDTPFADVTDVYKSAWSILKDYTARLYAHGIGSLVDFHALPGGANDQEHSGTSSGKAELWDYDDYRELSKRCVLYVASAIKTGELPGCIGIQLCNEATWGAKGMYEWYRDVIRAVGEIDANLPLYISDGWDTDRALGWVSPLYRHCSLYMIKKAYPA